MKWKHSRRMISSIVALSVAVPSAGALFPAHSSAAPAMGWQASSHQLDRYQDKVLETVRSLTTEEKARVLQLRETIKASRLHSGGTKF